MDNEENKQDGATGAAQQPETNSLAAEIENKIAEQKRLHNDKFDENGYRAAATAYAEANGSLENFNGSNFVKDQNEDKGQMNNGLGKSFGLEQKDGKFIARGSDGTVFEGKNFEEINDKVCENLAKHCRDQGQEATIAYHGNNEEDKKIFSRNALMKHDITITGGWPKDQKFWQDLKAEYLKDNKHSLSDWEKMTRKVPDDVMGRTPEEQQRNKKLNDADLLKRLRQGNNPNLEPQQQSDQKQRQANNLTSEQLLDMKKKRANVNN